MYKALKVILSLIIGQIKLGYLTPNEEKRIMSKYEHFLSKSLFFYTTNFDEIGKQDNRRLCMMASLKVCSLIIMMRSIASFLWPTPYVRDLTCNGFHYLGNPLILNIGVIAVTLLGSFGHGGLHQYFNVYGQSRMFWYMNKIKNRHMKYKLNGRFNRKFYRRLNLIAMLLNKTFLPSFIVCVCFLCSPLIIGFFDEELNFSVTGKLLLGILTMQDQSA